MLKISYAGCLGLSAVISAQFAVEMCVLKCVDAFVRSEDSEKQCLVMTKAARRHGADVIRYSLRGTNASTGSVSSSMNPSGTRRLHL